MPHGETPYSESFGLQIIALTHEHLTTPKNPAGNQYLFAQIAKTNHPARRHRYGSDYTRNLRAQWFLFLARRGTKAEYCSVLNAHPKLPDRSSVLTAPACQD